MLPALLGRLAGQGGPVTGISPVWREIVGKSIAAQAEPKRLEERHLIIAVKSALWAKELSLREQELVARLRERMPALGVDGLRFELA